MEELETLPGIRVRDELLIRIMIELPLVEHKVILRAKREIRGFGFRIAVEADDYAVAGINISVSAVEFDAVQDDAGVGEFEEKGRLRVRAFGDGGGGGDCGRCGGSGDGGGGVGGADA